KPSRGRLVGWDMADPTQDQSHVAPVKATEEARAGYETGKNRWILGISLGAVVLIFLYLLASWISTS
ncbi:MAG: hypothetical protein JWM77_354, partial [Rhodospirillales bacterium]|nr:hypothetical protein [Rhodospirillales bacterium]